jgi:hypothetical protein
LHTILGVTIHPLGCPWLEPLSYPSLASWKVCRMLRLQHTSTTCQRSRFHAPGGKPVESFSNSPSFRSQATEPVRAHHTEVDHRRGEPTMTVAPFPWENMEMFHTYVSYWDIIGTSWGLHWNIFVCMSETWNNSSFNPMFGKSPLTAPHMSRHFWRCSSYNCQEQQHLFLIFFPGPSPMN